MDRGDWTPSCHVNGKIVCQTIRFWPTMFSDTAMRWITWAHQMVMDGTCNEGAIAQLYDAWASFRHDTHNGLTRQELARSDIRYLYATGKSKTLVVHMVLWSKADATSGGPSSDLLFGAKKLSPPEASWYPLCRHINHTLHRPWSLRAIQLPGFGRISWPPVGAGKKRYFKKSWQIWNSFSPNLLETIWNYTGWWLQLQPIRELSGAKILSENGQVDTDFKYIIMHNTYVVTT
jgi:hypothetical protein